MKTILKKQLAVFLSFFLPAVLLVPQSALVLQAESFAGDVLDMDQSLINSGEITPEDGTDQNGEADPGESAPEEGNPDQENPGTSDPETGNPDDSNPGESTPTPDSPDEPESGEESNPLSVQFADPYISATTTLDEQGNPYLIVIEIKQALPDNDRKNPYKVNLGTNPTTKQTIALSGNARLSAQESASVILSFGPVITSAYLALPVRSTSMSDGTVVMLENNRTGRYSPLADSYLIQEETSLSSSYIVVPFEEVQTRNAVIQVVNNAKIFADLSSIPEWGQGPVNYVSSRNIMMGTGNGETFSSEDVVTRAQFATTIYRFSDQDTPEVWPESVPHGFWWSTAAGYVVDKGLMGVGSSFDPNTQITREQAATIFYRASGDKDVNTSVLDTYKDKFRVSEWALDGMAWAVEHEILGQGSNLDPGSSLNRLELAALIERYLQQGYI